MEQDIDNNMTWSVKQNEKALNISFLEKAFLKKNILQKVQNSGYRDMERFPTSG